MKEALLICVLLGPMLACAASIGRPTLPNVGVITGAIVEALTVTSGGAPLPLVRSFDILDAKSSLRQQDCNTIISGC